MDREILNHVTDRIASAKIETDPFPYFHIDRVFPEDYYQELLESFPDSSSYHPLSTTGAVRSGTYVQRFCLFLEKEHLDQLPFGHMIFWSQFADRFKDPSMVSMLLTKFQTEFKARFGNERVPLQPSLELISDFSEYAIGPHTDHPQKILTLLFYFPRDDQQRHLGTSIYRPIDPNFRCEGLGHHPFKNFTNVYTAPFLPNSVFGFFKSDRSFHGVEPIGKQKGARQLLSYQLLLPEK